jgi:Uma2 family endonuclease
MEGAPNLCVEVISPSSVTIDRRSKFRQYAKAGVKHYWIVDPRFKTIECHALTRGKYELVEKAKGEQKISLPPFDDLQIPLSKLWRMKP